MSDGSMFKVTQENYHRISCPGCGQLSCTGCGQLRPRASQPQEVDVRDSAAEVQQFAEAMKAKMHEKSMEGRGGWNDPVTCSVDYLASLLLEHIPKGDPVDIGNFAMMLFHREGGADALRRAAQPPSAMSEQRSVSPPPSRIGPTEPDDTMVICPVCTSQFRAIPLDVQRQLAFLISRAEGRSDE